MKKIVFHEHAIDKLKMRGLKIELIETLLEEPDSVVDGLYGRRIAQKIYGRYSIRVVYEEYEDHILVITAYPTKSKRYR